MFCLFTSHNVIEPPRCCQASCAVEQVLAGCSFCLRSPWQLLLGFDLQRGTRGQRGGGSQLNFENYFTFRHCHCVENIVQEKKLSQTYRAILIWSSVGLNIVSKGHQTSPLTPQILMTIIQTHDSACRQQSHKSSVVRELVKLGKQSIQAFSG